jgi:UDP-2-acetamido-3-amino-2,3-dideoxy-glucuronate N-acetyltransferase
MNTKADIGVGIVGLGHWGPNLARNHEALGSLAALCDSEPARLARVSEMFPDAAGYPDLDAMLGDPNVDAIAIATPAATHGRFIRHALDAGKHVFVEKPLCLDIAEAYELRRTAEERDLVLMVGHLLLYHPGFVALNRAITEGRFGKLRYMYSTRLSLGKFRREENTLWSFAPHDVSMILEIAGRLPVSVAANGGHYLTQGVADTTMSHLTFDEDLQAHIFVSWLHPYKDQRLVVVGEKAMAVMNDVAQGAEKLLLYPHKAHWDGDLPVIEKADAEPIPYEDTEPLRVECEAFLAAIRRESTPPSNASEGIRVLKVLDACQQSLVSGKRVDLGKEPAARLSVG